MGSMPIPGADRLRAAAMPLGTTLPVAVGIGLLMSTQVLFQPFVWRNWPLDEILLGWLDVARDCVVVACLIALALRCVAALPVASAAGRALLLGFAIVAGAIAGQWLLGLYVHRLPMDAGALLPPAMRWAFVAASVSGVYYLWRRADEVQAAVAAAQLHRVRSEQQAAQAVLQSLRSQIEPHFLFNTLATVRRLQHTDPHEGAQLLAHFIDYLRLTLPARPTDRGRLGDELALLQAYLGVVSVRMSGRLRVEWDVPDELHDAEFPPLIAATLVENAIKHGLTPAPGPGRLRIAARRAGPRLEVEVVDTGIGFSGQGGCGIGLANIRARLHTAYGDEGRLRLAANAPSGVRALVQLPWRLAEGRA